MQKYRRGSSSSFSGCGNTGLARHIKNYWPSVEMMPTLKARSSTGLLVLNEVTQVAKTSRDLEDSLQIWQNFFTCSYKIILSVVCVYFQDISVSLLQL
jgi:hypothetical protein